MELRKQIHPVDMQKPLVIHYCGFENCEPLHSYGPAVRPHYLIHFILRGAGCFRENKQEHCLTAGDAFLIRPNEMTFYMADEEDPWEYTWLAISGFEAGNLLSSCGFSGTECIYRGNDWSELLPLIHAITDRFQSYDTNEYELLGNLYFIFALLKKQEPLSKEFRNPPYLKLAKEYIWNHYSYDIRIQEVAQYIGIDRTYLYKLFMAKEKLSPMQYLIQCRLSVACRMLEQSSHNITEIALSCGFQDVQSFCRHFKKHRHLTPMQYRNYKNIDSFSDSD